MDISHKKAKDSQAINPRLGNHLILSFFVPFVAKIVCTPWRHEWKTATVLSKKL
ncbi:MAG: hypothetical protein PHV34_24495 [Verrucomicrobiae bacterium]|nr:hypothetical protein [Verrucomicrobiae bacterium]